ncbi:hypothetical protein [Vulcanisaeta thermophila]|uniref:hypothetical protein n=1 Tax=Vulcanisaeta thermophila TaxID=867917 RepID=UPI000852ED8C|nr:hypothetical protein [Vulcanisaeta thermophila]
MLGNDDIERILRDFRVCYDKFIVHACVVPLDSVKDLVDNNALTLGPGEYVLSGTRVTLTTPCTLKSSSRYLVRLHDGIYGMYIMNPLGVCEVRVSWDIHGINAVFSMSEGEALVVLVRLMRDDIGKVGNAEVPRIIKSMGLRVRVLFADEYLALYLINDSLRCWDLTTWKCISELTLGNWSLIFNPCADVSVPLGFPQVGMVIRGSGELRLRRYYPALGRWYDVYSLRIRDGLSYLVSVNLPV